MSKNLVSVLVPFKFLVIMTHVLAVLCTSFFKEDNIMAGLASDTKYLSDTYNSSQIK